MDKVYTPEVIQESPFPGEPQPVALQGQPNPAGTYSPATAKDKIFPIKRTSVELLSQALNTRSRKILEQFELQQSGGFQIGNFKEGISGDLRLTPNGLTARDMAGLTTFAIDGETGDATFKGTVQARDFVIADENGLVSAAAFQSDSYRSESELTVNGTQSFTLVSGSTMTFTLVRPAKVLITFFANTAINATDALRGYYSKIGISIDDSNPGIGGGTYSDVSTFEVEGVEVNLGTCLAFAKTYLIPQGAHTISLKWATFSDVGSTVYLRTRGLDYCMLGS